MGRPNGAPEGRPATLKKTWPRQTWGPARFRALARNLLTCEAGCPGGVFRPASPDTGAQKKLPALIPPGGQHVVQVAPTDQRP
nr:hypothetical protein [Acinetobacter baumannii]